MIEVNKNRTKTDEAWERLYARLDEDNLLTGAGREGVVRRKFLLKWGTLAAISEFSLKGGNLGGCRNCRFRLSGICVVVCSGRRDRKPQSGDARKS